MARKRAPEPQQPDPELKVPPGEAAEKIDERIATGDALRQRNVQTVEDLEANEAEYRRWTSYNEEMLKRLFTTSAYADEYSLWIGIAGGPSTPSERLKDVRDDITEKIHRLRSVRDRLDLIPLAPGLSRTPKPAAARPHMNRVFVVHGHDESAREAVARFLERLGIEAIILHEQATEGRTIIEKLEHYADVDFRSRTPDTR